MVRPELAGDCEASRVRFEDDSRKMEAMSQKRQWWNPGWSVKVWAMVAFLVLPTLAFAVWVLAEAGGETAIDPGVQALAEGNAGAAVIAISGTEHTSYHSPGPLPSADAPREDGRLTLVWFTGPSCAACAEMGYIHPVMADYRDEVVTVEKAVDRDSADERLGIRGVPALVVLDAEGAELARVDDAEGMGEAEFRGWVATWVGTQIEG